MNDAAIYGVAIDDEGDMFGVELGYYGSPITTVRCQQHNLLQHCED